ncbi:putative methyltransferase-domain-containing protein [Collybia nuda]|uniref:Methyltransferase-domain-containing protein n=1 Tax=Collybia nuda TaxID=64659 RepID=A0A9P6CHW1_9AGAR|nr:putative methyltransferase-domain-containing protein [Collybia nuda]
MTASPNFPKNLDINPSAFHFHRPSDQKFQQRNDESDITLFGENAQRMAIKKYGIAGRVWEAAYMLSLYVNPPSSMKFDPPFIEDSPLSSPRTILELGSGTGMVSLYIAKILDTRNDIIIVTDLPEVCSLLENNLKHKSSSAHQGSFNNAANVHIRPLSWGDEEHFRRISNEFFVEQNSSAPRRLSHVICSDLVYFPELLGPLLRTLIRLTSSPLCPELVSDTCVDSGPVVVISYKIRSLLKEAPFWSAFGLWFKFKPVLVKDTAVEGHWQRFGQLMENDMMFVFIAHRQPGSCAWELPTSDQELLDGRGAWGDNTVKGDDTFETLLFMTLGES